MLVSETTPLLTAKSLEEYNEAILKMATSNNTSYNSVTSKPAGSASPLPLRPKRKNALHLIVLGQAREVAVLHVEEILHRRVANRDHQRNAAGHRKQR